MTAMTKTAERTSMRIALFAYFIALAMVLCACSDVRNNVENSTWGTQMKTQDNTFGYMVVFQYCDCRPNDTAMVWVKRGAAAPDSRMLIASNCAVPYFQYENGCKTLNICGIDAIRSTTGDFIIDSLTTKEWVEDK